MYLDVMISMIDPLQANHLDSEETHHFIHKDNFHHHVMLDFEKKHFSGEQVLENMTDACFQMLKCCLLDWLLKH